MFTILVLLCPVALDHAACDQTTAISVIHSMPASTPQQCGFLGQAMLAPTALVSDPTKQFVKIMCVRDRKAAAR